MMRVLRDGTDQRHDEQGEHEEEADDESGEAGSPALLDAG